MPAYSRLADKLVSKVGVLTLEVAVARSLHVHDVTMSLVTI